jgi:hypothetical protein
MSVVLIDVGDDVVVRTASLWRRARARLFADRWDRDLSEGVSPDSCVERSLRAEHLARPTQRRLLARALRRSLEGATLRNGIAVCQDAVMRLASRLESPRPVSARGLAMAHILVTDGTGPLHYCGRPSELRHQCLSTLAALEPGTDL